MEGAVPGQAGGVGGVVATAGPATEEPHHCTGRSLSLRPAPTRIKTTIEGEPGI